MVSMHQILDWLQQTGKGLTPGPMVERAIVLGLKIIVGPKAA